MIGCGSIVKKKAGGTIGGAKIELSN